DFEHDDFVRDGDGRARRCRTDESGLLIAKVDPTHPAFGRHGKANIDAASSFRSDVFGRKETWYVTGDILRRDADGDYWYVDRTTHLIRGPHGWIAARQIEDVLYQL